MRVLVTGGAGYVGGVTAKLLLDSGHQVVVLDDLSTGHIESIDPRAFFVQGDILDEVAVNRALLGCEAIMHFAAKSVVSESVENPNLYHRVNYEGSRTLFELSNQNGIKKVVLSSTCAVYGSPDEMPIEEDAPTLPANPYGESKLAMSLLMSDFVNSSGFAAISLRYCNVVGAVRTSNGWLSEKHEIETHLVPNVLHSTEENPVEIFGIDFPTTDGTGVRDYVHVADIARAHLLALDKFEAAKHQVVNLGSGVGVSVREVISTTEEILGRRVPFKISPRRAGDPAMLIASNKIARELLNWQPELSLSQMISDAAEAANLI